MLRVFNSRFRGAFLILAVGLPLGAVMSTNAAAQTCPTASSRLARLYDGNGKFVTVLAHRGLWGRALGNGGTIPENSYYAIVDAQTTCMDGVELDVKMTSDNEPVLMHDFNLGRTTNVWQTKSGAQKYSPENNTGYNPLVSDLPLATVQRLRLLSNDRSQVTQLHFVASVIDVLSNFTNNNNRTYSGPPIVFDLKTASAVRAVSAKAREAFQNAGGRPGDVISMKVNASTYQSRNAFERDAGGFIRGIPVFVTNNLGRIDITKAFFAWADSSTAAIELNVKTTNGILQGELNIAKRASLPRGTFNALPDYPNPFSSSQGRFYDSDGHCCYTLADKYFTDPAGNKEKADERGSWDYINNQGFTFVTSDNPRQLITFLASKGKR